MPAQQHGILIDLLPTKPQLPTEPQPLNSQDEYFGGTDPLALGSLHIDVLKATSLHSFSRIFQPDPSVTTYCSHANPCANRLQTVVNTTSAGGCRYIQVLFADRLMAQTRAMHATINPEWNSSFKIAPQNLTDPIICRVLSADRVSGKKR